MPFRKILDDGEKHCPKCGSFLKAQEHEKFEAKLSCSKCGATYYRK